MSYGKYVNSNCIGEAFIIIFNCFPEFFNRISSEVLAHFAYLEWPVNIIIHLPNPPLDHSPIHRRPASLQLPPPRRRASRARPRRPLHRRPRRPLHRRPRRRLHRRPRRRLHHRPRRARPSRPPRPRAHRPRRPASRPHPHRRPASRPRPRSLAPANPAADLPSSRANEHAPSKTIQPAPPSRGRPAPRQIGLKTRLTGHSPRSRKFLAALLDLSCGSSR